MSTKENRVETEGSRGCSLEKEQHSGDGERTGSQVKETRRRPWLEM